MSINSLENAVKYSAALDELFAQKSVTGFFADNMMAKKFVGAKTVIIPDIDFQGLADYDRDTGFTRGAITVANTSYTMQMDRARSLQIDREDMDETGIALLAGKILGEYVRTKVVPECDAYVLSKLAGLAAGRANTVEGDIEKPYEALIDLIHSVQQTVGFDEELVAFIDSRVYAALQKSGELSHNIIVSDFKQGNINLKVNTLNGVALIPVVGERMKTAYTFNSTAAGGFTPAANAKQVFMLVCPKRSAHLVCKTEKMRIFTPEQNIDADAYKFDYRIYYDVFVKKSELDTVWCWLSPEISITSNPANKSVTEGSVTGSLSVTAAAGAGDTLTYQWFECEDENGANAVKIAGETAATMALDSGLTEGKYYYFVRVTVNGIADKNSSVACVTVA